MNQQSSVNRITEVKEFENQARFVNNRVNELETFFGDLCSEVVAYTRRTAKLRNNGDEIAKLLLDHSVKDKISRSSAYSLKRLAEHLASIEDYRHTEKEMKTESAARKRELTNRKRLEKSGNNEEALQKAQLELHQSILDSNRSADELERQAVEFESKRLNGFKTILTDFVQIEMLWHAKALETLTEAYNALQGIHEEADLADFRTTLLRSASVGTKTAGDGSGDSRVKSSPSSKSSSLRPSGTLPRPPVGGHHQQNLRGGDGGGQVEEELVSLFTQTDDDDDEEEDKTETQSVSQRPANARCSGVISQGHQHHDASDDDLTDDSERPDTNDNGSNNDTRGRREEDSDSDDESDSLCIGNRTDRNRTSIRAKPPSISTSNTNNVLVNGYPLKSALKNR